MTTQDAPNSLPNIILVLCDDMGFSDIGCYGSEIRTPNLDRLASNGVRFTQMYNAARCCPSRAALLTGVYPHQAGIGHMTQDLGNDSYRGYLNASTATIAEVLRTHGYRTMMSGKWHVGGEYLGSVALGDSTHPVPTQRGFDRFYGLLGGAGSYFNPPTMLRDETPIRAETLDFYLTDAISDAAVDMVQESDDAGKPFFLYVGYTAPHWPLHAPEEDIARYRGRTPVAGTGSGPADTSRCSAWACWTRSGRSRPATSTRRPGKTHRTRSGKTCEWRYTPPRLTA